MNFFCNLGASFIKQSRKVRIHTFGYNVCAPSEDLDQPAHSVQNLHRVHKWHDVIVARVLNFFTPITKIDQTVLMCRVI